MTRLASTGWTSALLGLAFSGVAAAQTAPADDMQNDNVNDDSLEPNVNTSPNTQTNTQNNTPGPTPMNDPVTDTTSDALHDDTSVDTTTTVPPPGDVNVDVNVEQPEPVVQSQPDYVPPPTTDVVIEDEDSGLLSGIGIAIAAGGGASGFTDDTMRNTTDVGGDWDVRLTLGTRSPIAFEGSYIGSAQSIDALGLDSDAILVGNGVQGALRVNATIDFPVQPFAFGGAAWRRYDLTNADTNLSDVAGSDDVLEIPLGIGVAGRVGGLMLDARGEYRYSTEEDLVPSLNNPGDNADMHRWGVKATAGIEF